jgi:hypothetical protein
MDKYKFRKIVIIIFLILSVIGFILPVFIKH